MKKFGLLILFFVSFINLSFAQTPQSLPFSQNWTNTGLITTNNVWSGVPGIEGYRGDDITTSTGVDPQTLLSADFPGVIFVTANQMNPNLTGLAGVFEYELTDPVVAIGGSGTADAPYLRISIKTTGKENIQVSYNVRDIDGSGDNAIQQLALQYRIGNSGSFTNIPAGYIADASTGPNLATLITPISVTLPGSADNQSEVQIRIITSNAVGNDEWLGIDDISITGTDIVSGTPTISLTTTGFTNYFGALPVGNISAEQSYGVTGTDLTEGIVVTAPTGFEISLTSGSGFVNSIPLPASGGTVYVRFAPGTVGLLSGNITHSSAGATPVNLNVSGTGLKLETTNHVTSFVSVLGTPNHLVINLSWVDAIGATSPDGYLIKASTVDFASIIDPADGTPETNSTLVRNVAQGVQVASFTGLTASTPYYFKIYPYTNSGSNINYKVDGIVPQTNLTTGATPILPNLFFSEYVEGTSNNKAVEIINISGVAVDLAAGNYVVQVYANGGTSPSSITLAGTIQNEDVFVLTHTSATTVLLNLADQSSGSLTFNGDDAVVLRVGGASGDILDVIGQIGFDPGTFWGSEPNSTLDHTLRRQNLIAIGDRNGFDVFDPATEWNSFNIDDFTDLGNPSLPVELTSFSATSIGKDVKLSWNTATEVNNYGFEIERKILKQVQNDNWEKIGFVNGNGNSNSPKDYSFVDDKVTTGKYSYRLKQIDNDGAFEYSKVIEIDANGTKKYELTQNYPNPFNPTTTIQFQLPTTGMVKLTLYNILGQEIKTLVNEVKDAGTHTVNFDASELNSGVYIYKIESGLFTQTRKMTLVK